jgi:D-alanyl-D-alanine dipeptidase
MAIDIIAVDKENNIVDMGTAFDFFVDDPEADNPAARHYTKFSDGMGYNFDIWLNRQKLEFAFRYAATSHNMLIDPLSQEWWDFRFKDDFYGQYAALVKMIYCLASD